MSCGTFELTCHVTEAAAGFLESTLGQMAREASEAAGRAVAGMGTLWVAVPTPDLTSGGGSVGVQAGDRAANAEGIVTVLGWVQFIGYLLAALSIIAVFVMMFVNHRRGESLFATKRLAIVLFSTVLIGAAGPVAQAIGSGGPQAASNAVMYLQRSMWWYSIAAMVLGIIVAAIRMIITHRLEAGRDLLQGLITMIVISGAGVTGMNLLIKAMDSLAARLIDGALECGPTVDSACFGGSITTLLVFTSAAGPVALPAFLLLILSVVAIFASAVQIVLMVVRSALMVVFAGLLPTAAAGSGTRTGRDWLNKLLSWTFGWMLYKPIAAFIYAAAFMLTATPFYADDGTGWVSSLGGLALMLLALFALPTLFKAISPAIAAAMSGSGGGGMGAAAGMGAIAAGGQIYSASKNTGGGGGGGGSTSQPPAKGTNPVDAVGGGTGGGTKPAGGPAGTAGGGAATTSGATAGGTAAGGAAAGGGTAAAGAAGGPVGLAVGAGVEAAKKTAGAVKGAIQGAAAAASDQPAGTTPTGPSPAGVPTPSGPPGGGAGAGGPVAGGASGGPSAGSGAAQGAAAITAAGSAAMDSVRRAASDATGEEK